MRVWKHDEYIIAVADKGKALKTEDGYFSNIRLTSEDDVNVLNEVFFSNGVEITEEMSHRFELLHELKEIRDWFTSTDYIPNKVIVGEWASDDPRFITYCEERKKIRARQDEIKKLLGYSQ